MSNFFNGINNGANTPVIYQNTDANRPTAPLAVGSLFVSQTSNILQRWDGSGWVTVGGSGTGSVTSVNGQTGVVVLTTTDIAEGSNLYYTDARARAALSAGTGISYNQTTGQITNAGVTSVNGQTGAVTLTTVTSVNGQTGVVVLTTTNVAEGSNLYYTDARARAALSAGTGIGYNQTTGQITNSGVTSVNGQTGAVTITGAVTSVNGQTGVVVLTTTDIAEGSNLYYTDARARAALSAGTGISYNSTTGAITNAGVVSFNGSTGAITYTAPVTSVNSQTGAVVLTTTNIAEGSNLYYTDGRARAALSGGTGVTYNSTTGVVAIGQSVATSATPVFAGVQANGSGGLQINNSSGTLVATFGSANTTNASIVGGLNVGGNAVATGYFQSNSGIFLVGGGLNPYIFVTDNYSLRFGTNNIERAVISSSGQFLYNTAGVDASSVDSITAICFISAPNLNYGNAMLLRTDSVGRGFKLISADFNAGTNTGTGLTIGTNNIQCQRNGNANFADLYLNQSGSSVIVGNGTTTGKFHVFGGSSNITLNSGNSLAGTITGTGTNVGAQWKFISDNNTTGAFIGIAAGESTGDAVFAVGANKKLVFGIGSAGTSRAAEIDNNSVKIFATAGNTSSWVSLGSISGVTSTWLLGGSVTGATVAFDTTAYLNITHNGTNYKLALAV
jgi:hypothetical protein